MNKKKIMIITIGVTIVLAALVFVMIKLSSKDNMIKDNNKTNSNVDKPQPTTNYTDYSSYTEKVARGNRTIEYYYNIYTPAFNKTKYNKKISFFGTILEGPLTIKKLTNSNITFKNNSGNMKTYKNGEVIQKYNGIDVYIDGVRYPQEKISFVVLIDAKNGEDDEIYFNQGTTSKDVKNIIVPYMENVDLNNITIDDLIDSLGVPTYVDGRDRKLENVKKPSGPILFSYVYDYEDDIFVFDFVYYKNTGINLTDMKYFGKLYYTRQVNVFNDDKSGYIEYNGYKEYYEYQYNLYQEDLKR